MCNRRIIQNAETNAIWVGDGGDPMEVEQLTEGYGYWIIVSPILC
jgi:hypothetical protein